MKLLSFEQFRHSSLRIRVDMLPSSFYQPATMSRHSTISLCPGSSNHRDFCHGEVTVCRHTLKVPVITPRPSSMAARPLQYRFGEPGARKDQIVMPRLWVAGQGRISRSGTALILGRRAGGDDVRGDRGHAAETMAGPAHELSTGKG